MSRRPLFYLIGGMLLITSSQALMNAIKPGPWWALAIVMSLVGGLTISRSLWMAYYEGRGRRL